MFYTLDYVLLGILAGGLLVGVICGFFAMVTKPIKIAGSLLVAYTFSGTLASKFFDGVFAGFIANERIAHTLALAASFALIYLVTRILLGILFKILDTAITSGPLAVVNRLLGAAFGILLAMTADYLLIRLLLLAAGAPAFSGAAWLSNVGDGKISAFFASIDPIDLISQFIKESNG